jgi:hypothetical protein
LTSINQHLENIANPSFWEQFLSISALIISFFAFIFSVYSNNKQKKAEQEKSEKYVIVMQKVVNKSMSEILELIDRELHFISEATNPDEYVKVSITYTSNEISSRYELLSSFSFFDLESLNADYLYESKTIILSVVNYFIAIEKQFSTDQFQITQYKKTLLNLKDTLKFFIDENR